jgi:predicted flap endonuclease-1-like 5' DNA nuclease
MPDERLWSGPLHGRLGVLADDGERVQCHLCGAFFGNLGGHVSQVHGVSPEDYKRSFGLNATTGLIGPALRAARQREGAERKHSADYARFVAAGERARADRKDQPRATKGRQLRLEQRLDPTVQAARLAALARANAALAERRANGTSRPSGWGGRDPKQVSALGQARLRELRADPTWRQRFAQRVSEARGGRLTIDCVVCGKTVVEPHSHRRRKTCSPACRQELRRRANADRQARSADDKAARAAEGVALTEQRRAAGLGIAQLAALAALSPSHVSRIERGLNIPSRSALDRLAAALQPGPSAAPRPPRQPADVDPDS